VISRPHPAASQPVLRGRAGHPAICSYENSRYRTRFWPGRKYEDRAERIALAKMLPPSGKRLCEIGAGFGRLADEYAGYDCVVLLDYSVSLLREAAERLENDPRFIFVAADLYDLPFADSALDSVVTVRVLHHVVNLPLAFAQIARVLRPRGAYVTEFANKRHLKARLRRWVTGRGPDLDNLEPHEFIRLNFDFHPRQVVQTLGAAGFRLKEERAVSTFRVAALKRLVPSWLLAWADGLLQRPLAGRDLTPSIFLSTESGKPGDAQLNRMLWRCLTCGSTDFEASGEGLVCRACGRIYPILEDIIDFR